MRLCIEALGGAKVAQADHLTRRGSVRDERGRDARGESAAAAAAAAVPDESVQGGPDAVERLRRERLGGAPGLFLGELRGGGDADF